MTEKGSDELLGTEAIEQEQTRVFMEELALGKEEIIARDTEPEDDEDTPFEDSAPPDGEVHEVNEELPSPVQEI